MDPRGNPQPEWTAAEVEEARKLVAGLSARVNRGDLNKRHSDMVEELRAWFPLKTTQQVTNLYVDLIVEMNTSNSNNSYCNGNITFSMTDLVNDNMNGAGGVDQGTATAGFPSHHNMQMYMEEEEVTPPVQEMVANHHPVVRRRAGRFWTIKEHKKFLLGIRVYGRGSWKNISRYFVPSRTPIQISSHAQKFFRRQEQRLAFGGSSGSKQRYSINDVGLDDNDLATDPWFHQYSNQMQVGHGGGAQAPPVAGASDAAPTDQGHPAPVNFVPTSAYQQAGLEAGTWIHDNWMNYNMQ